jgi:uncharacterized SAM-binding protein YcdF (DUF218 family)
LSEQETKPTENAEEARPASAPGYPRTILAMLPRAAAILLGGFMLCNLLGNLVRSRFNANDLLFGFDTRERPILMWCAAALLLWTAWRPPSAPLRRIITAGVLVGVGLILFFSPFMLSIRSSLGLELSHALAGMHMLTGLAVLWLAIWAMMPRKPRPSIPLLKRSIAFAVAFAIVLESFLLAQLYVFGSASDARQAGCIVVLGAAVNRDGTPSLALIDRTRAGCELYNRGLAGSIILSGGVTYGVSEPKAMADIAVSLGVPAEALVLDEGGYSTYGSAQSVRGIMKERRWRTALVVSHDYHLSRTWLAFRRAGIEAYTTPAHRSEFYLKPTLFQTFRESAAWVYYYFRPLWEPL